MSIPSIPDEERTLQNLEREKAAIEDRPHDGYKDASRVVQLESEAEFVQERILRDKQRAEQGEG
jgi:hypothetical protein